MPYYGLYIPVKGVGSATSGTTANASAGSVTAGASNNNGGTSNDSEPGKLQQN